jgi:hypothetical protein
MEKLQDGFLFFLDGFLRISKPLGISMIPMIDGGIGLI